MTGTAATEEKELKETYSLKTVVIPDNKPCIRKDRNDILYITENAKNKAIIEDIKNCYSVGRPVLVGTLDIAKSELLSNMLKQEGIPHNLLNAKQHALEAKIVEKAGEKYSVTIATNMAGRGTDIKLTDETRALGGLKIIASERAINRRIDNQLRGRSGRQGDPGESQFYLSFQDELIAYITKDKLKKIEALNQDDDKPLTDRIFSNVINRCQKKLEAQHFETRKNTTKYDKIVNNQRIEIYNQRDYVLTNYCSDLVRDMVKNVLIQEYESIDKNEFASYMKKMYQLELNSDINIKEVAEAIYNSYVNNDEINKPSLNYIILTVVDNYWVQHLVDMAELKQDIRLMSYRGEDPVRLYAKEGFKMFEEMNIKIQKDIVRNIIIHSRKKGTSNG